MKFLSNILVKAGLIVEGTTDLQGTATALTPATSDNTTKIATTAFVKAQGYLTGSSQLDWNNVINRPTTLSGYGITDPVVLTSGSYTNPSWIVSLAWSKITGTPTSLAGYGITDPVVLTSGSYSNPSWIIDLAWSKITVTPTTLSGYGITDGVPSSRTITINGTSQDLSANRTFSVGTVTSVAALTLGTTGTDLSSSVSNGTTTPVITLNVPTASATNRGALSSADWTTFNNKQNAITLTTTGSSGSSTLVGATLNIPTYTLAGLGGISLTSLSAFVPLIYNNTTGQFSIIQSNSINDGYLSATDWTTFNGKVGGSGTSGQVAYFNGTNSITSSPTFAFTPTSQLLVNNSVTAASAIARGINATPTLTAAANNDVLVGLDINPTFTNGAFTGVTNDAVRITGLSRLNGNVILGGANDRYIHYNTTSTILAGRDGSAVYFGYNFGSQLIDIGSLGSGNIRFRTSGNTIVESGKLLVGTSTDAGFRLDISGTARVQGNTTISLNQNANTDLNVSNTTAGTGSAARIIATSNGGNIQIARNSTTTTAYKILSANNGFIYNSASDLAILNDAGTIKMAAGGSSAAHFTIDATGNILANQVTSGTFTIGSTTASAAKLEVTGSITAASAIARGVNFTNTLVAAANNDVLVGLDVNPTFTNGAFTGVTNLGLRVQNDVLFTKASGNTSFTVNSVAASTTFVTLQNGTAHLSFNVRGSGSTGNMGLPANAAEILAFQKSALGIVLNSTAYLAFGTNTTEQMRLVASTGNLLLNTTTDAGFRLDVNGTARVQSFTTINAAPAVNSDAALSVNATTNNSTGGQMYGIRSVSTVATNTGNLTGIDATINNSTTATNMAGFNSAVNVSANTTAQVRGYSVGSAVTGTGIVTNFIGYDFIDVFKSGSGAITRQIAYRIANLTAGSSANIGILFNNSAGTAVSGTWDIYSQSGNASYLAGNLLLGTTTAGGRFTIQPTNDQVGMSISGSSLTGSNAQSLVSLSQTWNTTGNPTAFLLNITNTASGATADLMDLQVGGASRFEITAAGRARLGAYGSGTITGTATYNLAVDASGNVIEVTGGGGGGGIGGSGTTNYLSKFTASTTLGNSQLFDNGTVTFLGNGDVNATPSTGIFSGTGGTGTNIAGAELRIRGGASTGNAAGGIISFYTSAAGTSGTGVNAATERMRLSAGNFLINQTTSLTGVTTSVELTGAGNTDATQQASYSVFANHGTFAANTGYFVFNKSRGTTAGSVTAVASGDRLGMIRWNGADGTAQIRAAEIYSEVDGTPGTNDMPGRIVFATTLDGASSPTERMRITNSGTIGIGTATIGSTLQVNGNAAIGYSASTAAPTNGLAVSGNVVFGGTASVIANYTSLTINGTSGSFTEYQQAAGNTFRVGADLSDGGFLYTQGNTAIRFGTNGSSERMRITNGGNVGIGTTTIGSKLQVNGNAAIGYSASTAAPTNGLIVAGNAYFGGQIASLTDVMQLKGSGNVLIAMQSTVNTQFSGMNLYNEAGTLAASFALGNSNTGSFSNHFFLGPRTASGNLLFVTGASGTTRMTMTTNGELQFTPATNTSVLSTTGAYSLTGANTQSLIDLTGTWNTTGNPTAIKLNITNTASGANSLLMDLQVGGTPEFRVTKSGNVVVNGSTSTYQMHVVGTGSLLALGEESFTTGRQMLFGIDGSGNGEIQSVQQGTSYRNLSINPLGGNVGIATSSPTSTLHANGSVAKAITTKTATYTLTSSDHTVIFNLNGNATANLPDATTCTGRIYMIKINRTNTTDTLTIDPNGTQTIDGFTTFALQCQYAVIIQSDGSNWQILADFGAGLNCL